ncbi:MAG: aspartate ammonia-lyase [Marinilabiliales bacterium]|nr:MAG: aspartate ammonia-lyase [Marinilabiliales bacterium]
MRKEKDFLGEILIDDGALFGIHSQRAKENFPLTEAFSIQWYKALGLLKYAVYKCYESFSDSVQKKFSDNNPIELLKPEIIIAMQDASLEISEGKHYDQFIVPGLSGAAGTSINMNINEIITNRALEILGKMPGDYSLIDPVEHANVFQSTNDVIPTALRIASMTLLNDLEHGINDMRAEVESLEAKYRDVLRPAYTQMQEAVPSSWGIFFSSFNDAFSRDWWRVSKVFERIKVVNIGGGATGTSMAVPRYFVMNIINELRAATSLPLARGENLNDATSNLDVWVEAHAILKSLAVNLEKFASDLRLMASDIHGTKILKIPERQVGSSIMPGKVNPVISEFVISVSHQIYANDSLISQLAGQGQMDLNAYIPLMGHRFLQSLDYLISALKSLKENMLSGLEIDEKLSHDILMKSPVIATALIPLIGYNKAAEISKYMRGNNLNIYEANEKLKLIDKKDLEKLLKPGNLLKQGYSLNDLI